MQAIDLHTHKCYFMGGPYVNAVRVNHILPGETTASSVTSLSYHTHTHIYVTLLQEMDILSLFV